MIAQNETNDLPEAKSSLSFKKKISIFMIIDYLPDNAKDLFSIYFGH